MEGSQGPRPSPMTGMDPLRPHRFSRCQTVTIAVPLGVIMRWRGQSVFPGQSKGEGQPPATCSTCWTATSNASEDGRVKPVWEGPSRRVTSASYPASARA